MYVKIKVKIDDLIFLYKGTNKDLIALQLQAIKDTGHGDIFEKDFNNHTLCDGDIINFAINVIPLWIDGHAFDDTNELIIKRIIEDLNSKHVYLIPPTSKPKKQAE